MLFDFQQFSMIFGGLLAFPDFPFSAVPNTLIEETPEATGTTSYATVYGTGTIATLGQPPEQ